MLRLLLHTISTLIFICVSFLSFSQETDKIVEEDSGNIISFSFGYTFVPEGDNVEDNSEGNGVFVPSIGFDYFKKVSQKWELGIMLDWELSRYIIRKKELERDRAFLVIIGSRYSFANNWGVLMGAGIELEKNENLAVFRAGIERTFEIGERWFIGVPFYYDLKKGYDSWTLSTVLVYEW